MKPHLRLRLPLALIVAMIALMLLALAPAPRLSAQESVFPLPSDLFILTSDAHVIRVDAASGGQSYVTPEQQLIADFAIAPDSAWLAYRMQASSMVIVSALGNNSGYVLGFDAPAPPQNVTGPTIGWSPDASALAYLGPDGVQIALINAGPYGEARFLDVPGGPWDALFWRSPHELVVLSGNSASVFAIADGDWTLAETLDNATADLAAPQIVLSTLSPEGVTLNDGTIIPGTAGATAFDWAPVPPQLATEADLPASLTFRAADVNGITQVWMLPADGSAAIALTASDVPVTAYGMSLFDGETLAYTTDSALFFQAAGSDPIQLAVLQTTNGTSSVAISGDDQRITYHDDRGVWIVPVDASTPPELVVASVRDEVDLSQTRIYQDPQWQPDPIQLLVNVGYYEGSTLAVIDLDSGAITELTSAPAWNGLFIKGGEVLSWGASFGYARPGLYLIDPATPATARTILDESHAVLSVSRAMDGHWIVTESAAASMGPQFAQVRIADNFDQPLTLLPGGAYLNHPQTLATDDGTHVIAGLLNAQYDHDGQPWGPAGFVRLPGSTETFKLVTPGPVTDLRWNQ